MKRKPLPRGGYQLPGGQIRPNKVARGFSLANLRNGHKVRDALLGFYVHGTGDVLARVHNFTTERSYCTCCRAKTGPVRLTEAGRRRLRLARQRVSA